MKRWRIRPILAVTVLTVFAVATIAVSTALLLWSLRAKELAHARSETASLSHVLAEQTTRTVQSADLAIQNARVLLSELVAKRRTLGSEEVHDLLGTRLSGIPEIASVFVVDADGRVVNSSRYFPAAGIAVADREYFTAQKTKPSRGLFIGTPTRNRIDKTWTLHLSRRLNGLDGEFRGVIVVALNLGYFENLYKSIAFDGIGPISLYLANGVLVASEPHDERAIGEQMPNSQSSWLKEGADESTRTEMTAQGDERIVTYRRVSQFPLLVSVAVDRDAALAGWRDKAWLIVMGAFSVVAFVVAAAFALARALKKEDILALELLESGERLLGMIDSAMDAIVIADAGQRVILFNPAAQRMFGCAAAQAIGAPLGHFLPERHRTEQRWRTELAGDAGARATPSYCEIVGLRADGKEFPVESAMSQMKLGGDTLFMAILRDVTERREAEEQLRDSNRQLRELSGSLQKVREEERTRIARELHDELGQQLTVFKLDLSWLANHIRDEPNVLLAKVGNMKQQVDATIKSVRRISTELRPTLLDDLGLGAAMEWLATDFSRRTGVAVDLDLAGEDYAQGDVMVTALFRIMQECLTNVARHADATQVRISLLRVGDNLELTIDDNGKGTTGKVGDDGQGLVGIRERAILLGGRASFSIHAGTGATINVTIPLGNQAMMEPVHEQD